MNIVLAIILGIFFGFTLQRVGATNPQNIINMLRLKDLHRGLRQYKKLLAL